MKRSLPALTTLALLLTLPTLASAATASFVLKIDSLNVNARTEVGVPVRLQQSSATAAALAFVVSYDATKLAVHATAGQPLAIPSPTVPPSFQISSYATVEGSLGRVGILIFDPNPPIASIANGVVTQIAFDVLPGADGFAFIRIDSGTLPSASNADGNALLYAGKEDGGLTITPNRPLLSVEPAVLSFGSVPLGSAADRLVILANSGSAPLIIGRVSIQSEAPFTITSPGLPLILQPGASATLAVHFAAATPGTFASSLSVEGEGVSTEIPLTASATEAGSFAFTERLLLPAAAHVPGASGSQWRTRLTMYNQGSFSAGLRLRLLGDAGTDGSTKEIRLAPGESRRIDDVIRELTTANVSGAVEIDASTPDVLLSSSTYNLNARGGQTPESVSLVPWKDLFHSGQTVAVIGLDRSAARRTSATLINLSSKPIVLNADLLDESGHSLGKRDYLLQPQQIYSGIDIFDTLAGRDAEDVTLVLSTATEDATFFAYASTVDNDTGAPLYEPAR